ncbi:MAG: phosphoribulokinase [Chloroflexota bacterium]
MTAPGQRRPIVVGIVGDSAAGKTTLTAGLVRAIGPERVTVLCTDDYHRYDRTQREENGITPLHPDCNYIDILTQHMLLLRSGEPILKPVYNHKTGTFDAPVYTLPREFIVAEGLHGFSTEALRLCFDIKIYLAPPEEIRRRWKVKRDTTKRGYTPEQVLDQLERREQDSANFIRPQKVHADIVVRFQPSSTDGDDAHLDAHLTLYASLAHPDLQALVAAVDGSPPALRLEVAREANRLAEILDIAGTATDAEVSAMEKFLQDQMGLVGVPKPEEIGVFPDGISSCHSRPLALTQLLIAYQLLRFHHTRADELMPAGIA